jgi:tetratricopeptide (TPR) repeat protein
VAEEILGALSRVAGLRVAGRASAAWFRGKNVEPGEIARRLGVTHLLAGSVRWSGSRLRITAEVVKAESAERLWSQTFDREPTDLFAVQEEIASAAVAALRLKLLPGRGALLAEGRPASPAVHRLYLLGRHLLARSTRPDVDAAVRVLGQAVEQDLGFLPARVWLAYATWNRADLGPASAAEARDPDFDVPRAAEAALRASDELVALAPDLADAYWMRGFFRSCISWDWTGATSDYELALALSPGDTRARLDYAGVLAVTGRLSEALALAERVVATDPLSGDAWRWLGVFQAASGTPGKAAATYRRGLEVAPDNPYLLRELGYALVLSGGAEEALALFARHPVDWMRDVGLAVAHHQLGHDAESRRALDRLVALEQSTNGAPEYQIAEAWAFRGDRDQAFRWLEMGLVAHDAGMNYIQFDPLLASLRDDPRYAGLLRKMNLPTSGAGEPTALRR